MCRGCTCGDYDGLTLVTVDNIDYQNLDENIISF